MERRYIEATARGAAFLVELAPVPAILQPLIGGYVRKATIIVMSAVPAPIVELALPPAAVALGWAGLRYRDVWLVPLLDELLTFLRLDQIAAACAFADV